MEEMDVISRRVSSTHTWRGRRSRRSKFSWIWEVEVLSGYHYFGFVFGSPGLDSSRCLVLATPGACSRFGLLLLRPGRLPGDGNFKLFGSLHDWLWWIWFGGWSGGGLDTLHGRRGSTLQPGLPARLDQRSFWSGRLVCGGSLSGMLRHPFGSATFASFHLIVLREFAVGLLSQPQHWSHTSGWKGSNRDVDSPKAMNRDEYPQLRCMCSKHWQHFHCNGSFGATYDSNVIRKPQLPVSGLTFGNSGTRPRYNDERGGRAVFSGLLIATSGSKLHYFLVTNVEGFELLVHDDLRHSRTEIIRPDDTHSCSPWSMTGK